MTSAVPASRPAPEPTEVSPADALVGPGVGGARRGWRVPKVVVAVAIAALLVSAAVFWSLGGRWLDVRTPSMGTAAPVGTLVLTVPTTVAELQVGDVISFHPEDRAETVYTHRVVEVVGDGVHTRGDINGATDPWMIRDPGLLGRVAVSVPALGWLVRALPLLVAGALLLWGASALLVPERWRGTVRMLSATALFSWTVVRLRPFLGVTQLASTGDDGVVRLSLVSTGLLPVRVHPTNLDGITPLDLRSGQTGVLAVSGNPPGGRVDLATSLHLSPLGWVVLALVCLTPLLWSVVVGVAPVEVEGTPTTEVEPADDADVGLVLLDDTVGTGRGKAAS